MNAKRLILAGLALVIVLVTARLIYTQLSHPLPLDANKIVNAIWLFTRDRQAHGAVLPPTLPLHELVASGYLKPEDVKAFEGMEVTISLTGDESRPHEARLRAKLPDGTEMVLLGDGSVQQTAALSQASNSPGHPPNQP